MTEEYIASWLWDHFFDNPEKFPPDYTFDSIVDELHYKFDDQVISDHLDELLTELLNRNK